jgi:sulfur carrier protein
MLHVNCNGQPKILEQSLSLAQALTLWGYLAPGFAVAINAVVIPRSTYATTQLHDGDQIEIVAPFEGG